MKRLVFALFAACLLCLPYTAQAAEADTEDSGLNYFTGEVGVDVRAGGNSGSDAKANEYGPRESGMGVGVDLEWVKNQYQFQMDGYFNGGISGSDSNQGFQQYDYNFDASFRKFDSFNIDAFAQRIIHNTSDGRRGHGDPESTEWRNGESIGKAFTFNKVRTNAGIGLEANFGTPFFASVGLTTRQVEGIMPLNNANGSASFTGYPLDYDVNIISGEFGYRADNLIIKLDGSVDQLNDGTGMLSADADHKKMPIAESDNYKIGGSLSWRIPALSSTLMVRGSFANLTSDWMSTGSYYSSGPGSTGANGWHDYKGDIKNTVINAAFTSRPIKGLTTKVYVNYFDRDNDSEVDYKNDAAVVPGTRAENYLAFYEYERLTAGAQAGYRFGDYKIAAGYEYEGLDRSLYDVTEVSKTDDNRIWAEFDAQLTDTFAVNLGYQFLNRDSSETERTKHATGNTPSGWEVAPWFSYADSASKMQHEITAGLEFTPTAELAIALDYVFTFDDYTKDQELGLDDGYTHGLIADISYDFGKAQVALYGGVEYSTSKMNTRNLLNGQVPTDDPLYWNPNQPDTTSAFNWDYEQKDITWSFGLNGNFELVENTLDLQLRYDFVMNDGETDFSIPAIAPANRQLTDLNKVDDYTEHMLSAILTYQMDENNSFGLGYSFSYLDYEDWAYDNNTVTGANKLSDSYYNVDSSYEIHTVGLTYKYKF